MSEIDDLDKEIDERMRELSQMKQRIERKRTGEAETKHIVTPIKIKRTYEEEYEPKKEVKNTDPVTKYLGGGDEKIEQIKQQDKDFVHKRIAAQEVYKWVKKGVFIFAMNIIGFFMFYMFVIIGAGLLIDIIMIAMVILNAFFLMQMRRHQIYLTRKYNIQTQRGLLSGMGIPKIRRYNPRGPKFQQNPQDLQYDDNDPQEYQDGEQ
jgi:hypothetical protein